MTKMRMAFAVFFSIGLTGLGLAKDELQTYEKVDILDVVASPDKWLRRNIEISNARVYWAGEDDIRIVADGPATIFVRFAAGPQKLHFKRECSSVRTALSAPACLATVRFSFDNFAWNGNTIEQRRAALIGANAELRRPQ